MREDASHETPIGFEDIEERVSSIEKQVEVAGISLRETAKWIISGVAVAAAGLIARTSLSSLGALGIGWRLFAALSAAAVGFVALGYLFASALDLIVPPSPSLQDFAYGRGISAYWRKKIERKTRPLLPSSIHTLKDFCNYLREEKTPDGTALSANERRALKALGRLIGSTANSELRRLLFGGLKLKTLAITPIIALAIIVFAWAANPAKEELRMVPTLEKLVDVNQDGIAVLGKALGTPACVDAKLNVIVLGEWRSGVQDVVTVPKPSCPPVRLRLDQGRFSQVQ